MLAERIAGLVGGQLVSARPVIGGDVSSAFRVELEDRVLFAKTHPDPPEDFFATEASSLAWLRRAEAVPIPKTIAYAYADGEPAFLVLEWIEPGELLPDSDAHFGRALAQLHSAGAPSFGREDKRTTGSRALPNQPCDTWSEFYRTQRLEPLITLAADAGALDRSTLRDIERIVDRIDILAGPREPAARLHGDLWSGNRIVDAEGRSWLIDPAAHGGHREFDLAMMRLFGGFSESAFAAYDEVFPLMDGWTKRLPLHQLAPLMVHAIKFGGHYVGRVEQAILQLR